MPFLSLLSTQSETSKALDDLVRQTATAWTGAIDLALVFFSPHHLPAVEKIAKVLTTLRPRALLGCPGETIVANDRELEDGPALSLWLGRWAQPIQAAPFHLAI